MHRFPLTPSLALASIPLSLFACSRTSLELEVAATVTDAAPPLPPPSQETDSGPPPPRDAGPAQPFDSGIVSACSPALLGGAPTPIADFCSTRANLAPGPAPAAPAVVWTTPLPAPLTETYDEAIVVDGTGRTYTGGRIDDEQLTRSNSVVAVEEDGKIAWKTTFPGDAIRDFFLAADGTLRVHLKAGLAVVRRDGSVQATYPLPADLWTLAVGQDGSLYSWQSGAPFTKTRFLKMTPTGATVWERGPVDAGLSVSVMALKKDGHAVVAYSFTGDAGAWAGYRVIELDDGGETIWQTDVTSYLVNDPAIAPDGTVRFTIGGTASLETMHLLSLGASGQTLWDTDLGSTPDNVWGGRLVIDAEGNTLVRTNAGLVAVSATGVILWRQTVAASGFCGAFVGSNGVAVVAAGPGATFGVDMKTGATKWSLSQAIYPPLALAPSGAIVGTLGGQLFLAR